MKQIYPYQTHYDLENVDDDIWQSFSILKMLELLTTKMLFTSKWCRISPQIDWESIRGYKPAKSQQNSTKLMSY